MNITHVLLDEHRIIEQVLNCLERMADRCESHHRLESRPARDAIAFLSDFIEHCHDCKVEGLLLPAMQALGVPAERCLECPLQQSREDAHLHLDAMEAAIEPACAGNAAGLDQFVKHARAYIDVLLDCIARHEDCLFPLIEKTARKNAQVLPESGDREYGSHSACYPYIEASNRLAEHFGVSQALVIGPDGSAKDDAEWRCRRENARR